MGTRDARIDAYIGNAAGFARPILTHLREVVYAACPEVQETMKWSMPHFDYKGIFCGMAAFKAHCTFGFWKGSLIEGVGGDKAREAMGQLGRIAHLEDLPPDAVLERYIREAMRLNDAGVKAARKPKKASTKDVTVPPELSSALERNPRAQAAFDAFSPSHRREYAEWVAEAKGEATRERRVATAIEWLMEGKSRNWKYERR